MNPGDGGESEPVHLKGACFCGLVSFTVIGAPISSHYCHCTICQRLTGCPFIHSLHYDQANFSWTFDAPPDAKVDYYSFPERKWKTRARCKACGVYMMSRNSRTGRCSVWAACLERDEHGQIINKEMIKPNGHIFYSTRMLDIRDGVAKWDGYEGTSNRVSDE